jgi:hypothetical protein
LYFELLLQYLRNFRISHLMTFWNQILLSGFKIEFSM